MSYVELETNKQLLVKLVKLGIDASFIFETLD